MRCLGAAARLVPPLLVVFTLTPGAGEVSARFAAVGRLAAQDAPRDSARRADRGRDAIRLIVRPRVGDTLHVQVEQSVEMRQRAGDAPASTLGGALPGRRERAPGPDYGPRADRQPVRVSHVRLFAHSLVEASDLSSTTLLATTDSLALWSGTSGDDPALQPSAVSGDGTQVRVRVTPDGAMRVADPPPSAQQLGATLAHMPGLLPAGAVTVGSSWTREMPLPSLPLGGYRADGVVQARLRLDSLTRGGRDAWISLTGILRRDGAGQALPAGSRVITAGTLRGTMVVDRVRAWIIDAWTLMDVRSDVVPGPAGTVAPMLIDFRIEQRVRVR